MKTSNVFSCPHCGAKTEIDARYLGQTGPCYRCERIITVPRSFRLLDRPPGPSLFWRKRRLVLGAGLALVFLSFIMLLYRERAMLGNPIAQMHAGCLANLEQIGIAMDSYHDQHGCYPPAYLPDDKGLPLHSWRVLLLPHLGFDWLYEQYRFDEPWNSDHNLEIVGDMPSCFACPFDPVSLQDGETNYMVVVGEQTMFPGRQTTRKDQLADGAAQTLMVVEVPGTQITWTEPADLDADQVPLQINPPQGGGIGSFHDSGAMFVTADGKVHCLPDATSAGDIKALLSINGSDRAQSQLPVPDA